MKNIILIFCLMVTGLSLNGQNKEFNKFYSAFSGEEGVVSLYLPGFLCRMAGNIAELDREERELLHSIKSFKILVIENPEINSQINLAKVMSAVETDYGVHSLLEIHDGEQDVIILAREEGEKVSELYVVVGGVENVMMRIKGRMDKDLMKSLYEVTGMKHTKYTREI